MPKGKIPDDLILSFFKEIHTVEFSHRSMLVLTQGTLELLINALAEKCCVNGKRISEDDRSYSYSVKLTILNEIKILTANQYNLLNAFRKLRNEAAHGYEVNITKQKLEPFKKMVIHGRINLDEPQNFKIICQHLVGGIWNHKTDIFVPYFHPNGAVPTLQKKPPGIVLIP